jgi:hypothetical protein
VLDPTRDPSGIMLVPGLTFIFTFMMVLTGGGSFFFILKIFDDLLIVLLGLLSTISPCI